jgi:hypothetical protein
MTITIIGQIEAGNVQLEGCFTWGASLGGNVRLVDLDHPADNAGNLSLQLERITNHSSLF